MPMRDHILRPIYFRSWEGAWDSYCRIYRLVGNWPSTGQRSISRMMRRGGRQGRSTANAVASKWEVSTRAAMVSVKRCNWRPLKNSKRTMNGRGTLIKAMTSTMCKFTVQLTEAKKQSKVKSFKMNVKANLSALTKRELVNRRATGGFQPILIERTWLVSHHRRPLCTPKVLIR